MKVNVLSDKTYLVEFFNGKKTAKIAAYDNRWRNDFFSSSLSVHYFFKRATLKLQRQNSHHKLEYSDNERLITNIEMVRLPKQSWKSPSKI